MPPIGPSPPDPGTYDLLSGGPIPKAYSCPVNTNFSGSISPFSPSNLKPCCSSSSCSSSLQSSSTRFKTISSLTWSSMGFGDRVHGAHGHSRKDAWHEKNKFSSYLTALRLHTEPRSHLYGQDTFLVEVTLRYHSPHEDGLY